MVQATNAVSTPNPSLVIDRHNPNFGVRPKPGGADPAADRCNACFANAAPAWPEALARVFVFGCGCRMWMHCGGCSAVVSVAFAVVSRWDLNGRRSLCVYAGRRYEGCGADGWREHVFTCSQLVECQ